MNTAASPWASYALMFFACIGVAGASGCGEECGTINQTVDVAEPDAELLSLVTDCKEGRVSTQSKCNGSTTVSLGESTVACACLPLCERVLALIDGFPGPESLMSCELLHNSTNNSTFSSSDAGLLRGPNAFLVSLSYEPSNCHAPAQ
jgi:hypothetical protein